MQKMTFKLMTDTMANGTRAVENLRRELSEEVDRAKDLGTMEEWVTAQIEKMKFERHIHQAQEGDRVSAGFVCGITDGIDALIEVRTSLRFNNLGGTPPTALAHRTAFERGAEVQA